MHKHTTVLRAFPVRALSDKAIDRHIRQQNPHDDGSAESLLWEADFRLDQFHAHFDPRRSLAFAATAAFLIPLGLAAYLLVIVAAVAAVVHS